MGKMQIGRLLFFLSYLVYFKTGLSSTVSCKSSTDAYWPWWCGNECITEADNICFCGEKSYADPEVSAGALVCLSNLDCKKDLDGNVHCYNASIGLEPSFNEGLCQVSYTGTASMPCLSDTGYARCLRPLLFSGSYCRGLSWWSKHCDDNGKSEQLFCKNHNRCVEPSEKECTPLPTSKHLHVECQGGTFMGGSWNLFNCLNRMDQKNYIFEKSLTQMRPIGLKLSKTLNYTEEFLYCNNNEAYKWSTRNIVQLQLFTTTCILLNGLHLNSDELITYLVKDQSFKGKEFASIDYVLQYEMEGATSYHYFCSDKRSMVKCDKPFTNRYGHEIELCIDPAEECDGTPHCPDGSDEDLDRCSKFYDSNAPLVTCPAPEIYNGKKVLIRALKCNGIVECDDGSDEDGCHTDPLIFWIFVVVGSLCIFIVSTLDMVFTQIPKKDGCGKDLIGLLRTFESNSDTTIDEYSAIVVLGYGTQWQTLINQTFFEFLKKYYTCNYGQILTALKTSLDPINVSNVLGDNETSHDFFQKSKAYWSSLLKMITERIPKKVFYTLRLSKNLYGHYADLLKDIFVITTFFNFLKNGTIFLKWTLGSLISSFAIPLCLASVNLAWNSSIFGNDDFDLTNLFMLVVSFPILPFLMIYKENQSFIQLENCTKKSDVEETVKNYRSTRRQTSSFLRTELGIENPLQLTFSILLILFARSRTSISDGLELIFEDTLGGDNSYLSIPAETVLLLGIFWTLVSDYKTFCRRMSWTKEKFPIMAKIFLFFYVTVSVTITVSANIIFFTPSLGLFSILRHFQGENLPYWIVVDPFNEFSSQNQTSTVADGIYFSDLPPIPVTDFTRFNYTDRYNPTPPPLTIYTYFELETILIGFWVIWFFHIFVVWIVKRFSNPDSYQTQNVVEAFINAAENCQIPAPMMDWDDLPGTIQDYKKRQRQIDVEMGLIILVNFLKHLLMMAPMWIFAYNVMDRHDFLANTIGYFEEELEAYQTTNFLAFKFPFILLGASISQFLFYWLYNHRFHPFIGLIKEIDINISPFTDKKSNSKSFRTESVKLVRLSSKPH